MTPRQSKPDRDSLGAWTKRCYFAGRAVMDAALRPFDLGSTQWYVLHRLAQAGPTGQRDLVELLQVERATMSGIVATLLRKGYVAQAPSPTDQRQKLLRLTPAGTKLWGELPDLNFIRKAALGGIDDADIATAVSVLQTATSRLEDLLKKGAAK